jgi:NTP pyrophosphatase (non-canonical NTP hydrolase)
MELRQIFELQKEFDRKLGWNTYEKCRMPEETLDFMEHFILVMVEELGEISSIRKQYRRDKQEFAVHGLRNELVDIFIYFMQACMALNMNLEKDYLDKLRHNEDRFLNRKSDGPRS